MGHHASDGPGLDDALPTRRRRPTLLAAGVWAGVVLALAAWLLSMVIDNFRYDAGLAGTKGLFTAAHCHTEGTGKSSHHVCDGTFVAADGRTVDPAAHVGDSSAKVGRPTELRRTATGGYDQPGLRYVLLDVTGVLGILTAAAFGLIIAVAGAQGAGRSWKRATSVLLAAFVASGALALLTLGAFVVTAIADLLL